MKLFNFLFGKQADIFSHLGQGEHQLGKKRWQEWENRFQETEYDWTKHSGTRYRPPSFSLRTSTSSPGGDGGTHQDENPSR